MNNILTQCIKENTRFRGNEEPSRLVYIFGDHLICHTMKSTVNPVFFITISIFFLKIQTRKKNI